MPIEVIKEGNILRVVEFSEPIPDGAKLVLYTAEEIKQATSKEPNAWEAAQLESTFLEDEEDWGDSLNHLVVKEENE